MIRAFLFDMDGTLADTEPLHLRALRTTLALHGRDLSDEVFHRDMSGRPSLEVAARLFPEETASGHADLVEQKETLFREMAVDLAPTRGLEALLERAVRQGLRTALVTNAPRRNAEHMLAVLGLSRRFDVMVLAGDLARSKPDPLPYLTALSQLSLAPHEALAFEDSVPGVLSATRAGVGTVGVATSLDAKTLIGAGATFVIDDFVDFPSPSELRAMIDFKS